MIMLVMTLLLWLARERGDVARTTGVPPSGTRSRATGLPLLHP